MVRKRKYKESTIDSLRKMSWGSESYTVFPFNYEHECDMCKNSSSEIECQNSFSDFSLFFDYGLSEIIKLKKIDM